MDKENYHQQVRCTMKEIASQAIGHYADSKRRNQENAEIRALGLAIADYLNQDFKLIASVIWIALDDANFGRPASTWIRALDTASPQEARVGPILKWLTGEVRHCDRHPETQAVLDRLWADPRPALPWIEALDQLTLAGAEITFTQEHRESCPLDRRRIEALGTQLCKYLEYDINTIWHLGLFMLNAIEAWRASALLSEISLSEDWLTEGLDDWRGEHQGFSMAIEIELSAEQVAGLARRNHEA